MASNLFSRGTNHSQRSAAEVRAGQDKAKADDRRSAAAGKAAGRARRAV